ncbi:alpha/beta hydrolase [Rhizobiaceae bacterium n13]|uniref:Alpha/beta hydrolase n=1 Tax=Ferirhizobium litorale TaxID=2927786 RepID=A0AAE3U1M9_9HYPH|nr:alpha/beta hydrolase [Fererhizobium litorale]MDI7861821.1 alpha/beta hydrolase [Fererhizobium litorale]MDI7921837.1 alpha/beta hydrolase [Fererhizobium litorale]
MQKAAALPVTFAGTAGLFSPAQGSSCNLAVLFLNPWGLEEMCTRKFWRALAESFGDAGIASLRFDYPSTANALDLAAPPVGLDAWKTSIETAIETLKRHSGASRVVVLGHGLGATLATTMVLPRQDIEAIALLAPVIRGRAYLRELMLWSKVVDDELGVSETARNTSPGAIAGLSMPPAIAEDVRKLDISGAELKEGQPVFIAVRPARDADGRFADHLAAIGCDVTRTDFHGYDAFVSNPLTQKLPDEIGHRLLDWLRALPAFRDKPAMPAVPIPVAQPLRGAAFEETPVRFGDDGRLHGTICRPLGQMSRATAVILSTAYDHQAGWGRSTVDLCRYLASIGISSLRFDSAGVGDSPPVPGRRPQILYDDPQVGDVAAAGDFLDSLGFSEPALVVGRCSGAYLAFTCAVSDPRWKACISINPYLFRWEREPTEEMLRATPRPLGDYAGKAVRIETFRRLLAGEVDVRHALPNIMKGIARRVAKALAPALGPLLPQERWNRAVKADFRKLSERNVAFALVYSERDQGLDNFRFHFGQDGAKLRAFPNVRLEILQGADHNLTPRTARERMHEIVAECALSIAGCPPATKSPSNGNPLSRAIS